MAEIPTSNPKTTSGNPAVKVVSPIFDALERPFDADPGNHRHSSLVATQRGPLTDQVHLDPGASKLPPLLASESSKQAEGYNGRREGHASESPVGNPHRPESPTSRSIQELSTVVPICPGNAWHQYLEGAGIPAGRWLQHASREWYGEWVGSAQPAPGMPHAGSLLLICRLAAPLGLATGPTAS